MGPRRPGCLNGPGSEGRAGIWAQAWGFSPEPRYPVGQSLELAGRAGGSVSTCGAAWCPRGSAAHRAEDRRPRHATSRAYTGCNMGQRLPEVEPGDGGLCVGRKAPWGQAARDTVEEGWVTAQGSVSLTAGASSAGLPDLRLLRGVLGTEWHTPPMRRATCRRDVAITMQLRTAAVGPGAQGVAGA